jgi:sugar phosphate isomerase/epimerase
MKLSFSTLACPDWTMQQIIAIAAAAHYDGIELRFVENEDSLWKLPAFRGCELTATKRVLSDHGLAISCVDTSCRFHSPDAQERARWVEEGERMADLAASLQAPGIRVFGEAIQPGADLVSTRRWIADSIRELSDRTSASGVEVWLETHGDFASAAVQLGARIRHVHLKDFYKRAVGLTPTLAGDGEFPLLEVRAAIGQIKYGGFVSFEWEKKWHPEIADAEIALPHFTRWFRERYEP